MELIPLKRAEEVATDAEVITAIENCIKDGINKKMELAVEAGKRAGTSKPSTLKVIEKYTGSDPAFHRWFFAVGAHGAKVYALLASPSTIDTL